ncbi:MAG TPA: amino acid ABC transporter permease [Ornithinimicrobium sp.]|uniref:amino acid ABC transporter permease n=1 Tax=Ornithinimicrobium sp. TaxID=1977084 RepID=UPI002B4AAB6C|nr:amino acid ABC transporter permease [Ornithinimicrobium sp.]HKJ12528.1 amino acid ABC transporter permease [Ornithinimicrobium sp.]
MIELIEEFNVLAAFWMTIKLALLSGLFALIIGTFVAILRLSPVAILSWAGAAYVTLIRNTPLTLIILFTSLGLWGQLGFEPASRDSPTFIVDLNFRLAVLGLSVYHAAFVCEAIRSGVNTIPLGQAEASRSLGLSFAQTLRYVILPQAFRGAITPLGNVMIALTKNTTVAVAIGVAEAAAALRNMIEFRPDVIFLNFFVIAIGFVILTLPLGLLTSYASQKLVVKR